jgi:hypothetical protein
MRGTGHRLISGLSGCFLLFVTLWQSYLQSFGFYKEHYVWPREKYGTVTPLRWQDEIFLIVFWPLAVGLFYLSYRLLKTAFRGDSAHE